MSTQPENQSNPAVGPARRGRKSVRTPDRAQILADSLALGVPIVHACRLARISPSAFFSWRENDAGFRGLLEESTARAVESRLKIIKEAAAKDYRAAVIWLQLCQKEFFGKERAVESVHLTQNNFTIPKELLDQIAEIRRQNEPKTIEAS